MTCAGLALPFVAAHRLADERVERLLLAGLNSATDRRIRGDDVVDDLLDRARVGDLLQALPLDDGVGRALAATHIASNTSLAILPEIVPSRDPREQAGQRAGATGAAAMSSSALVERGGDLAHAPSSRRASPARRRRRARAPRPRSSRRGRATRGERGGVVGRQAVLAREARAHRLRQLRQRRAHASIHASSMTSGGRSGSGK